MSLKLRKLCPITLFLKLTRHVGFILLLPSLSDAFDQPNFQFSV